MTDTLPLPSRLADQEDSRATWSIPDLIAAGRAYLASHAYDAGEASTFARVIDKLERQAEPGEVFGIAAPESDA